VEKGGVNYEERVGDISERPEMSPLLRRDDTSSVLLQGNELVPESVVQYVARTREDLVINDIQQDNRFAADPVVQRKQTRSTLCLPVVNQGKIIGILYAENNLNAGVFTEQRVQFMKLLSGQVAVSLENALQYEHLEQKVAERTVEVMQQKEALEKSLAELKLAQAKLVESEKMASLGQLTAGIAHEINNPINFVSVGVKNLVRNFEEAKKVMDAYLNPDADADEVAQQLSEKQRRQQILEIFDDSSTVFKSIQNGVERTINIVKSLRNFSRLDEGDVKTVDLHEGLDSTLEILQNQIKKKADVVKKYGSLPLVECAAGKINQVFMNILNNALQAMDERGTITLETKHLADKNEVEVAISDTGKGMSEEVKRRLFEPFFTTKPVGEGTGLGLSISYGIIEEHDGRIEVESAEGNGSTFKIFLPITQK
jgi:signal transduction histidine kinase